MLTLLFESVYNKNMYMNDWSKRQWKDKEDCAPALPSATYITLSIIKFSLSLYSNGYIVTNVHIIEQKLKGKESIPNNRIESVLNQKSKSVPFVCLY